MLRPENERMKRALLSAVETFEAAYEGSPAQEYMESRGIGGRTATAHRLGYVSPNAPIEGWERFAGRLCVPYLNINKEPVWAKFRATPEMGRVKNKYAQQEGGRGRLFNLPALNAPGDTICLAEGETDIMTLTALGIPAVGVPGKDQWKSYMKRCLDGYDRVVLFYDVDENEAGKVLLARVKASMPDVVPLPPPGGHGDLNEAYMNGYGDAIRRLAYGLEEEDHGQNDTPGQPGHSEGWGIPAPTGGLGPRLGAPSGLDAPGAQEGRSQGDDSHPADDINRFDGISNPNQDPPF